MDQFSTFNSLNFDVIDKYSIWSNKANNIFASENVFN